MRFKVVLRPSSIFGSGHHFQRTRIKGQQVKESTRMFSQKVVLWVFYRCSNWPGQVTCQNESGTKPIKLGPDHKIVDHKNRIEASVMIWKQKMSTKDGLSGMSLGVSLEKREGFYG